MAKAVKTRNAGTMTEAQFMGRISSVLRRGFMWWIPMKVALENARRPSQSDNKKLKWEFQCAHCKEWFPRKQVNIDHVIPCGTLKTIDDIPALIRNMTPENVDAYQVLCKRHHQEKTNAERHERSTRSSI